MPSSMIFVSLVIVWLLILVPAVARRQQEVARHSAAALSGRVLTRPTRRRWSQEVAQMDLSDDRALVTDDPEQDEQTVPEARRPSDDDSAGDDAFAEVGDGEVGEDEGGDERSWERPPARFRPGRGGYDPEAAALTARARYVARQRIVLGLLVTALVGVVAGLFVSPMLWWLAAVAGAGLVGYLIYLRRQVRMEEAIRERRAARAAGTRLPPAADDPELDEWARRGRAAAELTDHDDLDRDLDRDLDHDDLGEPGADEDVAADDGDPTRVRGVGEPVGVLPARPRSLGTVDDEEDEGVETALPRLAPTPPPPPPAGTSIVDVDEEELELSELDRATRPGYRRAVGE